MSEFPLHIDAQSVKDMIDSGEEFLLLDCREPDENAHVKIEGAKLIPMNEIASRAGELESHRGNRIVVHCHHGGRSMKVTQWLRAQGFPKVQNMTGGIDTWALLIDTSLPRY